MIQKHMLPIPLSYQGHASARMSSHRRSFCRSQAVPYANHRKDLAVAFTVLDLMVMPDAVELWHFLPSFGQSRNLRRYSKSCPACDCSICYVAMMTLHLIPTGSIF